MLLSSKETLSDQIYYSEQKNDNGNLINTMHHLDVNVGRTIRIFLPEKIATHLSHRKKFSERKLLILLVLQFV
jgi:hypothetical protein